MKSTLLATILLGSLALTSCSQSPSVAGDYAAKHTSSGDAQGASNEEPATDNTTADSTGDSTTMTPTTAPTPSTPTPTKPTPATPTTPTPATPTPATPSNLTYANVNTKVLSVYCTACHSSAGGNMGNVNLETYAKVKEAATKVKKETVTDKKMPPDAPLSADLLKLLGDWIAAGTPEK